MYKVETVKFVSAGVSGVRVCWWLLHSFCQMYEDALGLPLGSLHCSEGEEVNQ